MSDFTLKDNPFSTRTETDWKLCCLCQSKSDRELRCPLYKECHQKAYQTLENELKAFHENSVELPLGVTLESFDDGSGIAQTLSKNKAKYHDACRHRFRSHIIKRALEKRRREGSDSDGEAISPKKTRSCFSASLPRDEIQCVCCEKRKEESGEPIYKARSDGCGQKLCKWSLESKNWVVHARLNRVANAEDAHAADIYYHISCYTKLKNDARQKANASKSSGDGQQYDPLVVARLVAYLQYHHETYKLAELLRMYENHLQHLGSEWIGVAVHKTRFKTHLLEKLGSEWSAYSQGRDVYISHTKSVGKAVAETVTSKVTDDEAQKIVEVALLLRRYTLLQQLPFNGSFSSVCLSEPVAKPLLMFLDTLLQGTSSLAEGDEDTETVNAKVRVACTISQLICSNTTKRATSAVSLYQRKDRETPFPLYLGLKLHVTDRQKSAVSTLHALGASVSYNRVMALRRELARAVSKRFVDNGLVVPTNMKHGIFTTGAVDNIDQSGRCEFHGTAISLTNHPTKDNKGQDPPPLSLNDLDGVAVKLPEDYVTIPHVDEFAGDVKLSPTTLGQGMSPNVHSPEEKTSVEEWLSHVQTVIKDLNGDLQDTPVTYLGFLSHRQRIEDVRPRATVGVFPLFFDKAATMSMQKHAMHVVAKSTDFINPHQIPVLVADCPLYAIQKKCQWVYPNEVGEDKMVSFMGLLHVEMTAEECGGKLLAGSGWDRMFFLARIFETGVAASLLGGKNVKRTRYAYHLTLIWLHVLELEAYEEYCKDGFGPHEPMAIWERRLVTNAPTVLYWVTVREYLSLMCRFVEGQRLGDWQQTLSTLHEMCPWFFTFGHTNYARWLPVFLRDMAKLQEKHPSVHEAFMNGKFSVQRGEGKCSMMALDQSQEHSVKFLKGEGGTKGLYGQSEEKEMIELSRPEVLRILDEFESACFTQADKGAVEHAVSSKAEQTKLLNHLKALCNLVTEGTVINPFNETSSDLVTLISAEVMDPEITKSLRGASEVGKTMFTEFVRDRIENCTKPLSDVIPRANVFTFANRPPSDLKKGASKLSSTKKDTALVVKMFMSLLSRPEEDMADFFRHENSRDPPALSEGGKLRSGTKSEILECLPGMPPPGRNEATKQASVLIFDMAAVIHMIRPQKATVFGDYTQAQLLPFLRAQLTDSTTRLDAVWDTYTASSLKSQTREKRGRGLRTRVSANVPLPKGSSWQKFLLNSDNKDEFFQFLAEELHRLTSDMDVLLLTTKEQMVLSNKPTDLSSVSPCKQEEADTRMILHLRHAAEQGHKKAYLRTVDSDVVILAVSLFHDLGLSEVWVGFGTGKTYKDIPVHHIAQQLGPRSCQALAFFHAFTGCDCVSAFHRIGKKTAWNAWSTLPAITDTFIAITHAPTCLTMDSQHMRLLERLTVIMYSKTCAFFSVNEARQFLYTVAGKTSLEIIPPTQHALYQHARRAVLMADTWRQALTKEPEIANPADWGWEWNPRTRVWLPYWTVLPDVTEACVLLVSCGCKVACRGNCKCSRAGLRCSKVCKCQGGCTNNDDA